MTEVVTQCMPKTERCRGASTHPFDPHCLTLWRFSRLIAPSGREHAQPPGGLGAAYSTCTAFCPSARVTWLACTAGKVACACSTAII